jgi:hypothetical protein
MNVTPLGNYATVSRNSAAYLPTPFHWLEISQTLSGEFGKKCRPLIRDSLTPKLQRLLPANGRVQKSGDSVGTIRISPVFCDSLDSADRILAIKNPDTVWKISQTRSAKFEIANDATRRVVKLPLKNRLISANLTFKRLVKAVRDVHERLRAQAGRAINVSLTLRIWLIGAYVRRVRTQRRRSGFIRRKFAG